MMFDFVLPVFSEVIDANTIGVGIDDIEKFSSKFYELARVYEAFEN
jgi:hypothetical protein